MTADGHTLWFSYDAHGPMYVKYDGSTYQYITNLQGDIIAIVSSEGNVVVEYTYDAWGNILSTSGSMKNTLGAYNPLRYRGYVYDTETTLYYLQSRYYDPKIGRFINADALVSTGQGLLGNNMFAYCGNNPVVYIDTTGMAKNPAMVCVNDCGSLYIYEQDADPFKTMPFGSGSIGINGCGVIATYNAMVSLDDARSYGEIYDYFTSDPSRMFADGKMGASPWAIAEYFKNEGYSVISTYDPDEIELYSTVADACILLYAFVTTEDTLGAHYVEYSRTTSGYAGRNTSGKDGKTMFLHPSDYGYEGSRFLAIGIFVFK